MLRKNSVPVFAHTSSDIGFVLEFSPYNSLLKKGLSASRTYAQRTSIPTDNQSFVSFFQYFLRFFSLCSGHRYIRNHASGIRYPTPSVIHVGGPLNSLPHLPNPRCTAATCNTDFVPHLISHPWLFATLQLISRITAPSSAEYPPMEGNVHISCRFCSVRILQR